VTALERAMHAVNDRKSAVFGANHPKGVFTGSDQQDRAMFSGFDIGYGELAGTSTQVAEFYSHAARSIGLRPLFISAWCDGLLTGLLLASLPPTSESGVKDDTGSEGCPATVEGFAGLPCILPKGHDGPHQTERGGEFDGPGCGKCIYCQNGQRCPWPDGPPE
jgi:hypothetical protein